MKIGIDYREAVRKNRAGKGVVVFELVQRLKQVIKDDEVILYSNLDFDMTGWPDNFSQRIIRLPDSLYHFRMVGEIWWSMDRYLSLTSFLAPALALSKKSYIMVHDMVAFLPEFSRQHNQKAIRLERMSLGWAVKFAGGIIVPSIATKADLVKYFPKVEKKVRVIYEGFNYREQKTDHLDLKKYGEYIFFVSTLEPRKNLLRLIRVTARLIKKGWKGKVLLAGKKGWYYQELFDLVRDLGLEKRVIFLGYVTDEEKFAYMRGAKLVYAASLYEGFGLPVLEGMISRVPVITANISSLPEVAGRAAMMVDPASEEEIERGIWDIISNEKIAEGMVKRGIKQVKRFSWEKMAEEVYKIIRK